jgi:ubiquinone/menaquinone biosynthesis C-methylase UbiE
MSLEQTRADWTQLGKEDPLWAVLVEPGRRNGGWDVEAFFATGRREVDDALDALVRFGGPSGGRRALDFGCGVGRLSQALAERYDEVVGVDIAEPMLERARALDRSGGRCRFVLNTEPDLASIPDASIDLVFSSLVLQHIPPGPAEEYLREFSRIVRPGGGAVVVLLPTGTRRTVKGLLFRYLPHPVVRWAQRRLLGYPAPMRMHTFSPRRVRDVFTGGGLRTVGATNEPEHGPHWNFTRFFAVRD